MALAIAALPPAWRAGHDRGEDPDEVEHDIVVRTDSAGASHDFVQALADANIGFSIGFPLSSQVRNALLLVQEEDWRPAIEADGTTREGAWVIELTELCDLTGWPERTRLICRKERPHPGAQLSLFDTSEGFRHTCFITDTEWDGPCVLELRHRQHARVEDRVRNWKDCGLSNLPFDGFCRNQAWMAVSLLAGCLLAWSQLLVFDANLANAEPKTIRHRVLHVAATLVRRHRRLVLRLDENWPWATDLATAFVRLRGAFP